VEETPILARQLYLTFKRSRDVLDGHLAEVGASVSEWVVLRAAANEPGLSHRELADRLQLTVATLSHHLDRLERQGYLRRVRDGLDRRVVRVKVTASGARRLETLQAVATDHEHRLRQLLGTEEAATLHRLLAELASRLAELDPQGEPVGI
jgi:DNA-binding MarR family transcriptional regulator